MALKTETIYIYIYIYIYINRRRYIISFGKHCSIPLLNSFLHLPLTHKLYVKAVNSSKPGNKGRGNHNIKYE